MTTLLNEKIETGDVLELDIDGEPSASWFCWPPTPP